MKNILLIAYSYPPLVDAQSLRWFYIVKYLEQIGYKIDIVTISHPKEYVNNSININIHRVYPGFFENIAYKLKNKLKVDGKGNSKNRKKISFQILKKIYWLARKSFDLILPGNITTEWYPFVYRYINNHLDLNNYDYMITSHEPWVDSLIGLKLKQKHPTLKWVADFADPYVSIYTAKHKLILENYLERKIYSNTDCLILTNEIVKNNLLKKYSFLDTKNILILEQGFEQKIKINKTQRKVFTILYTGTFYEDFRNPLELSKALKIIDFNFRFILIGRNEKFTYLFDDLKEKFIFKGFCNHNEVLEYQYNADLLIHLSNKQIEQVPGKFYEYLGSKTTILMIYQNINDQLIELTNKLGCGIVTNNHSKDILKNINLIYSFIDIKRNERLIENYSWENRANILAKKLETL